MTRIGTRLILILVVTSAACSELTRSVLSLTITADTTVSAVDHLHIEFTDMSRGGSRMAAPIDVAMGAVSTIPPALTLPYVFGRDVNGVVHVRVQALDASDVSHGSGEIDVSLSPGKSVSPTVKLVPPGIPPGVTAKLTFMKPPASTVPDKPFEVVVAVVDASTGTVIADATSNITLALNSGSSGALLLGAATVQASGGMASFPALIVDRAATGLALTANADQVTMSVSNSFDVLAPPWVAANSGLAGRNIIDLVVNPTSTGTLYATGDGGAFKSTDGGASWVAINSGLPIDSSTVYSKLAASWKIAIDAKSPTTLYMASTSVGGLPNVLKTVDGGGNWAATATGVFTSAANSQSIAVDPTNSNNVYWGILGSGVYKSANAGTTWGALNTGFPANMSAQSIVVDPLNGANVYVAGADFSNANGGVFKSVSGGTWSLVKGGTWRSLAASPSTAGVIYAGDFLNPVVSVSGNGGTSWTDRAGLPGNVSSVAISPSDSNTAFAGCTLAGADKTTTAGVNWAGVGGTFSMSTVNRLAFDPSNSQTLYVGTNQSARGLLKSIDGGTTFVPTGLAPDIVQAIAIDPKTPSNIVAVLRSNGVFKSTDGGKAWLSLKISDNRNYAVAISPSNPSILYANGFGVGSGGIIRSSDGGATWQSVYMAQKLSNTETIPAIVVDPTNPDIVYAGAVAEGVFRTADGGATTTSWTAVNTNLANKVVHALAIDPKTPTTLYAGTAGGVFKTTNAGTDWTAANTGLNGQEVTALAIDPNTTANVYAATATGLFRSSNGGSTWEQVNGLPSVAVLSIGINPINSKVVYAGTAGKGVYRSPDGGATWTAVNNGIGGQDAFALAVHPGSPAVVYIGTLAGGVFSTTP